MGVFEGTGVALVTPFKQDGGVDEQALRRLVRLQVEGGTDFLVVQGTTGETATLTEEEKKHVLAVVIDENKGALPVVLGFGGNNTQALVADMKAFSNDGVDGYLCVSPYYNKPSQEGIYQHFLALSQATDKPIILYNVPGRTGSNMSAATTLRLAQLPNIVAVKEASGNLDQVMQIIQEAPNDFTVLSGDDGLTLPMMALGGHGVISVVANACPEVYSKIVKGMQANDYATARKAHYALLNITHQFFAEGNPAGVKVALNERGICEEVLRLPLTPVSQPLREAIKKELEKVMEVSFV